MYEAQQHDLELHAAVAVLEAVKQCYRCGREARSCEKEKQAQRNESGDEA